MTDLVYEACKLLKAVLQARAPYDTGNLALNSIRIAENRVIIGGEIAPYAPFTNEPWEKGRNPNEGWVESAIREAAPIIGRVLSGKATDADVQESLAHYADIRQERKRLMLERLQKMKEKLQGENAS